MSYGNRIDPAGKLAALAARAKQGIPKKRGRTGLAGLLLLLLAQPLLCTAKPTADASLLLGVFPHFPPRTLEKIYAPIAADMSKHLGTTVKLRTSTSFKKFSEKLRREEFDIVFLHPFDYVDVADKYGYIPLAARDEPLSTILVVPENSTI